MKPQRRVLLPLLAFAFAAAQLAYANNSCLSLLSAGHSTAPAAVERSRFEVASQDEHSKLAEAYKKGGVTKQLTGEIKRVSSSDLALDLNSISEAQHAQLLSEGRKNISELYYFTSGAGLWSRGGGQVKALIPMNLKACLSEADFVSLVRASDIVTAPNSIEVIKRAGFSPLVVHDLEKTAAQILHDEQAILNMILDRARASKYAVNPLDMKMVGAALNSQKAKTYIPFDVWTSEQTHEAIGRYFAEFKNNYRSKVFHPDPELNSKIHKALEQYLQKSTELGETHVFGYQVGFHGLDPKTGLPVAGTPTIGEGAGMAKAYLDRSGRTAQLLKQGKKTWVFENIEVVTDLPVALAAHKKSNKAVGVILVPQKKGYTGGSPFMISHEGKANLELHEMSALPKEFAAGNEYFNSNTIFQPLDLPPPHNIGFEEKTFKGRTIIRAKMNAGDVTLEAPTAGIGGRIGVEYENFKNYSEFGQNGENFLGAHQKIWSRDLK